MGRLRQMPGRLAGLAARVRGQPSGEGRDAWRYHSRVSRKWMNSVQWKRLRWDVLREAGFTCQWPGCGFQGESHQLVADHKVPHRDDPGLFWDRDNLQCLCKPCHDSRKQRVERGA